MQATRWVRSPRTPSAQRTDGLAVQLRNAEWIVLRSGKMKALKTHGYAAYLDDAISEVDKLLLPSRWKVQVDGDTKAETWLSGAWRVQSVGREWIVERMVDGADYTPATRRAFASPDRARVWAELRFDRERTGLRGPKPRAGSRARSKLPDVRVTQEERDFAVGTLSQIGTSYSEFVRAALKWANAHVGSGDDKEWALDVGDVVFYRKTDTPT